MVSDNIATQEADYSHLCGVYFEHAVSCFGFSYLVIFGYHINGAYICIPNWSIGCEATDMLFSIDRNRIALEKAGMKPGVALAIAIYIDRWLLENQEQVSELRLMKDKEMLDMLKNMKSKEEHKIG